MPRPSVTIASLFYQPCRLPIRFCPSLLACSVSSFSRCQFSSSRPATLEKEQPEHDTDKPSEPEDEEPKRDVTLRSLDRPLGFPFPPKEGENTGIDPRSLREKRDDFVDYERHLVKRRELMRQSTKAYFREWSDMRYHKGKTFIAPSRLFRSDKALFFPNLYGRTLAQPKVPSDTTPLLMGKISIVNVFSSVWAQKQTETFTGSRENPELQQLLLNSGDSAQRVDINTEDNTLKGWLVRIFMWNLRRSLSPEQHSRYFLVQTGFNDFVKEHIGMGRNSKIGWVYLLDEECKIRWAGNSIAHENEVEALNKGTKRLVDDWRRKRSAEEERHQSPVAGAASSSRRLRK